MLKYILQISLIIVGNLFAFLILGHILDLIFGGNITYKVICILLSVPSLIIIMTMYSRKFFKELKDITLNGKRD